MRTLPAAVIALGLAMAAPAKADLVGTTMDLTLTHTGNLGDPLIGTGPTGGTYTFGTTQSFSASLFGFPYGSWEASSPTIFDAPAGQPIRWHVDLDFNDFGYRNFAGEVATLRIENINEPIDASTIDVRIGASSVALETAALPSGGFLVRWRVDDVLPAGPFDPIQEIQVGWSSAVPGPGAVVTLAFGAALLRRRRRRG